MKQILDVVGEAWGWCGLLPESIYRENDFGNILVVDRAAKYWRIIPEELECAIVAQDSESMNALENSEDFALDWQMAAMVDLAREKFGQLAPGRKYCFKLPGVLGGQYSADNLGTISFHELIAFSGDMANQIKDLPNGAKVKLNIVE